MISIDKLMALIMKNLASLRLCVGTHSVNSYLAILDYLEHLEGWGHESATRITIQMAPNHKFILASIS